MSNHKGYQITDQYQTYFVTFTIVGWVDVFTRLECRNILIESLKYCQDNKGLLIHAYVIMGSHIHLIATASQSSDGLSNIIRDMKKHTAKQIIKWIEGNNKESRSDWLQVIFKYHAKYNNNNSTYQVWQQSNQPKACLHPRFTSQKIAYIHNNPVVSKIVEKPEDYIYSSARNYLGHSDSILTVDIIDFGIEEGYVMT
jgi:REP element-mobilizing transposase RayT